MFGVPDNDISHMATIVEHNVKTLQHLEFGTCSVDDYDSLRNLVGALSSNNTLKSIRVGIHGAGHNNDEVSSYMRTHHRDLTSDPSTCFLHVLFLSTLQCCGTIFMNVHIGVTGNPIKLAQVFMEGVGDITINSHVGTCGRGRTDIEVNISASNSTGPLCGGYSSCPPLSAPLPPSPPVHCIKQYRTTLWGA